MTFGCRVKWARQCAGVMALAAGMGLPLAGCGKEPRYTGDPAGVNRQAQPQVIVKQSDIYLDGHLIKLGQTPAAEIKAWNKYAPNDQTEADAYWDQTGITIHANIRDDLPARPVLTHTFAVWLRHDENMYPGKNRKRQCTPEEQRQHEESKEERLKEIVEDDAARGWSRDEIKERVRSEVCFEFIPRPEHVFSGYLEVDGIPLTANMTLAEIQARRKQLGLLPLHMQLVAGPLNYLAPRFRHDPGGSQEWHFVYEPKENASEDEQKLLKAIWLP